MLGYIYFLLHAYFEMHGLLKIIESMPSCKSLFQNSMKYSSLGAKGYKGIKVHLNVCA